MSVSKRCAVKGCKGDDRYFRFPNPKKDHERFIKWVSATGDVGILTQTLDRIMQKRLCKKHFEDRYFMRKKLTTSAVPTLLLPVRLDMELYAIEDTGFVKRIDVVNGSILEFFGLAKKEKLTVEERKLYNFIAWSRQRNKLLIRRKLTSQEHLETAADFAFSQNWETFNSLPNYAKKFFLSYFHNLNRKVRKRNYTMEDKIFAFSLYKRCASYYKYMAKIFCLPRVKSLWKLVNQIPIKSGISDALFHNLKYYVRKFTCFDKYCILSFGEIKLDASLTYNASEDLVDGFIDFGLYHKPVIADRVMVWMLKGINGKNAWKQLVAYNFCKDTTQWETIVNTFKEIVIHAYKAGLKVVASMCDQLPTYVRAIKYMINSSKSDNIDTAMDNVILIEEYKIVPLFHPLCLLKSFRNHFLEKDVHFSWDTSNCTATWSHIVSVYSIDKNSGHFRVINRLNDSHVMPESIAKQKLLRCREIFSDRVASLMFVMGRSNIESPCKKFNIGKDAQETARLLMFFNILLSSMNNNKIPMVTEHYEQLDIWNKAIKTFQHMYFLKSKPSDRERPPVLDNWISTLEGFKNLRDYLKDCGFVKFPVHVLHQDPLDNLFRKVRRYGVRNIRLNYTTFKNYYKSLLIDSFFIEIIGKCECKCTTKYPPNTIISLESMLEYDYVKESVSWELPELPENFDFYKTQSYVLTIKNHIDKDIRPKLGNCDICLRNVYKDKRSCINHYFLQCMIKLSNIAQFFLPRISHEFELCTRMTNYLLKRVNFRFVPCEHISHVQELIVRSYLHHFIVNYLSSIKNILAGSIKLPDDADSLMIMASHFK